LFQFNELISGERNKILMMSMTPRKTGNEKFQLKVIESGRQLKALDRLHIIYLNDNNWLNKNKRLTHTLRFTYTGDLYSVADVDMIEQFQTLLARYSCVKSIEGEFLLLPLVEITEFRFFSGPLRRSLHLCSLACKPYRYTGTGHKIISGINGTLSYNLSLQEVAVQTRVEGISTCNSNVDRRGLKFNNPSILMTLFGISDELAITHKMNLPTENCHTVKAQILLTSTYINGHVFH
ncbi:hypothetical protein L9F63_017050, partial [Diploptera punctata]